MELAKALTLVAPTSMTAEQHELWLRAALDSLQDIRGAEVQAISQELRRTVTRPNQIVPEIARLVNEKRQRANQSTKPQSPYAAEMAIRNRSDEMRAAAKGDKRKLSDAYEWERQARIDAGLHVDPYPKPLTRHELDTMPSHIRQLGLSSGFLEYRGDMLCELSPTGGR
jgi:hypothetical protein